MWWVGSEAHVYLGSSEASLLLPGQNLLHLSVQGWHEPLAAFADSMEKAKVKRVAVWLSGGLSRPFLIPPNDGLRRWQEVEILASAMAPGATQMAGPLDIWIGRWRAKAPSLAVATPKALQDALQALKASHCIQVKWVRPAWWWAAMHAEQQAQLLMLAEADAYTALKWQVDGALAACTTYSPVPVPEAASGFVARVRFGVGVSADDTTHCTIDPTRAPSHKPRLPFTLHWSQT